MGSERVSVGPLEYTSLLSFLASVASLFIIPTVLRDFNGNFLAPHIPVSVVAYSSSPHSSPLASELHLIRSRALAAHLEEVTGYALVAAGLGGGGAREHQGDNELLHCAVICACGTGRGQSGDAPVNCVARATAVEDEGCVYMLVLREASNARDFACR